MSTVIIKTLINAPIGRCFDLARSIDLHLQSMKSSEEKAIAGKNSGMIDLESQLPGAPGTSAFFSK